MSMSPEVASATVIVIVAIVLPVTSSIPISPAPVSLITSAVAPSISRSLLPVAPILAAVRSTVVVVKMLVLPAAMISSPALSVTMPAPAVKIPVVLPRSMSLAASSAVRVIALPAPKLVSITLPIGTSIVPTLEIVNVPRPAKVIAPNVSVPKDSLSYSMLPEPPAAIVSETASASPEM